MARFFFSISRAKNLSDSRWTSSYTSLVRKAFWWMRHIYCTRVYTAEKFGYGLQARRKGGSRGSNEPPLEVNNGGLKTQTVDFQLLANSGGMENKLWVLQLLNYPASKRKKYRESIKLLGEWALLTGSHGLHPRMMQLSTCFTNSPVVN